jgi:HlyD family secretion protein
MENLLQSTKTQKIREYVIKHKVKSIFIGILILIIGYYTYKHFTNTSGQTTYVLGNAQIDSVVASITGSGQVSTNHTLDIKPKVSANVTYVAKKAGDKVYEGDLIMQLDTNDAQKSVRDAEANLESAKISLQKIQQPSDKLTLLQAQNAVDQANSDLAKSYDDGFNTVSSTFIDMPSVIAGVDSILHNSDISTGSNQQQNINFYGDTAAQLEYLGNIGKSYQYKTDAETAFQTAKAAYEKNFNDYKLTSRTSDTKSIKILIDETYKTAILVADSVKSANNLIQYYQNLSIAQNKTPVTKSNTHLSSLSGYTNTSNSNVSNLSSIRTTISNNITSIPEKEASLTKVQEGADTLDIQSSQLSVKQRENALQDAKDNLSYYYIRAPFSGTLASISVKRGDPASTGSSVATIIADEQIANITLNEVDSAKVKIGDKVTLTFDAIDDLTLTGKISSIDTVGTVSQGVVNYSTTISFDSSDSRVKPSMSVTASIIIDTRLDVVTVPNSAIKSSANGSYVLMFDSPLIGTPVTGTIGLPSAVAPKQVSVETGLSDDTNTEIVSGLKEGDQIVTRIINPSTVSSTPSLLNAASGNRAGATRTTGAVRSN